jgi:hypothetical protein
MYKIYNNKINDSLKILLILINRILGSKLGYDAWRVVDKK